MADDEGSIFSGYIGLINKLEWAGNNWELDMLRRNILSSLRDSNISPSYINDFLNVKFNLGGGDIGEMMRDFEYGKQQWIDILNKASDEIINRGYLPPVDARHPGELSSQEEAKGGTHMVEPYTLAQPQLSNRIFIVHGHDEEMKASVAGAIRELGLEPIILHEYADRGKTIIEKIEKYADVSCAIVVLSPDDLGCKKPPSKKEIAKKLRPRARQNVILELGLFIGRLGRENVFVLYRPAKRFEWPSDYAGVLFKPYDNLGKWRFEIVKELQDVGYDVDANKLTKK